MFKPNGLCFSPDYKKVYIAETGGSHYPTSPKNIMMYNIFDDKELGKGTEFWSMKMKPYGHPNSEEKAGFADGIRCDTDGNVWVGSGWVGDGYDGVQIFASDGARIGLIKLPEICSNVCFAAIKRNRL